MKQRHQIVGAVFCVLLTDDVEVIFLRRKDTGFADGWLTLPSGHIEAGEDGIAAAVRELKEEVGVDANPKQMELTHTMFRIGNDCARVDFFFVVNNWNGTPYNAEPHKASELVLVKGEDAGERKDILPFVMSALEMDQPHWIHHLQLGNGQSRCSQWGYTPETADYSWAGRLP